MKKLLAAVAIAALALTGAARAEKLSVAATAVPHAEILNQLKAPLAKQGVELEVKVFTDYVQPNVQVAEKRLDANFFQHKPYLTEFNKGKGTGLVAVVAVHVEPSAPIPPSTRSWTSCPRAASSRCPTTRPTPAARCCCWTRPA